MSQNSINIKNNFTSPADIKNQELIDKALIEAGLPQNKLNGLVSMITDKLICDSSCQKERNENDLKRKWDLAQNNLKIAPDQVNETEKNYYIYTKGEKAYKDMIYDRNVKIAQEFKKGAIENHTKVMDELEILAKTFNSDNAYDKRLGELLKIKQAEEKKLKKAVDQYTSTTQTNGRKVVYEKADMGWVNVNRSFLVFIYYILFFYYLLISDYFSTGKYKNIKIWVMIAVYLLFPITALDWLTKKIFALYDYIIYLFVNRKYKNIYFSLQDS